MTKINIFALILTITSAFSATDLHDGAKPSRALGPAGAPPADPIVIDIERSAQQLPSFARAPDDRRYITHIATNSMTGALYIVHNSEKISVLTRIAFDAGQLPYVDPAADNNSYKGFTLCDPGRKTLYTFYKGRGQIGQSTITDYQRKLRPMGEPVPVGPGEVDALCLDTSRQILFFGNCNGDLQSFDAAQSLRALGKVRTGHSIESLTLLKTASYLYASHRHEDSVSVGAFDVSDPANLQHVGAPSLLSDKKSFLYTTHFPSKLLITNKQQTLVGSYGNIIRFYDLANPASPRDLGNPITFAEFDIYDDMSGDMIVHPTIGILMVAFNKAVHLFDTSNPATPRLLKSVVTGMYASQLLLMANRLLVVPDSGRIIPHGLPIPTHVVTSYDLNFKRQAREGGES